MGIARLLGLALVLESSVKALLSAARQVAIKREKGKMFIEEWISSEMDAKNQIFRINPGKISWDQYP